jgi:hypothetical protein
MIPLVWRARSYRPTATLLFLDERGITSSPYYDRSAAKWGLWFDWKERAQDRECLRCKHKGNKYKHYCDFHARRLYQNQSPFIILLRDLPVQVLKTLPELEKS